MARETDDGLWRDFPKTATEFETRFPTEADCRTYWIKARWGDTPACAHCNSTRLWSKRGGFLFECADCGHQTSLTSGTLLEKTRKPDSAKDLQRIMGFGSYKTAWSWLHEVRTAMARSDRAIIRAGGVGSKLRADHPQTGVRFARRCTDNPPAA